MIGTIADKLVRLRWAVLAAWAAGTCALVALTPATDPAAGELRTFLPDGSPSVRAAEALAEQFPRAGGLGQAVVVFERRAPAAASGHGTRPAGLTEADRAAIAAVADRLRGPLPPRLQRDLATVCLPVQGPEDFPEMLGVNPLVSDDGAAAVVRVSIPANFITLRAARVVHYVREVLAESALPGGLDAAVTGSAAYGHDYAEASKRSNRRAMWVTVLAVLAILLAVYRSPLAAAVVLAAISLAAVVTHCALSGAAAWGLHAGTAERIFVFVLLYGVGVDYSLLYLARFREFLEAPPLPRGAMAGVRAASAALAATCPAILASASTDIVGLAMLSAASFAIFRTTGMVLPIALITGLLAVLTLIPALAAIFGRRLFWPGRRVGVMGGDRLWPRVGRLVLARRGLVLGVALAILAVPAVIGARLHFVYDALTGLDPSYGAVRGAEMVRRHWPVGQTGPTTVLLTAGSPHAASAFPELAESMTERLLAVPGVADVRSLTRPLGAEAGPVAKIAASRHGGDDPLTLAARKLLIGRIQNRVRAEYVSADNATTRLEVVFDAAPFSDRAMATLGRVRQAVAASVPERTTVHLAGPTPDMADVRAVTQTDFRRIAALALAAIFAIVLLLVRDLLLTAFMILTTLLSYLAALGITWVVFVAIGGADGLDWKVQVFLFVVMVAVGVDYNIFLAARMREEARRAGPREAVRVSVVRTGGIICSAGLIMAATLGSLMAGDISLLRQLGFAFAVGMLIDAIVIYPLVLPAFALITGRVGRARGRTPRD